MNIQNPNLLKIQNNLINQKRNLEKRLTQLQSQDPFSDPDRVSDNATDTDAGEESDHDRVIAIIEEVSTQITQIETALKRINEGNYGICISCGNPIEEERLVILPTAEMCLSCEKNHH